MRPLILLFLPGYIVWSGSFCALLSKADVYTCLPTLAIGVVRDQAKPVKADGPQWGRVTIFTDTDGVERTVPATCGHRCQ